jgi:hypothetical protein
LRNRYSRTKQVTDVGNGFRGRNDFGQDGTTGDTVIRAVAGFAQTGVDDFRPERMFGVSTNNLLKNIGWTKKSFLSFNNTPLNIMTFADVILVVLTAVAGLLQVIGWLLLPELIPEV